MHRYDAEATRTRLLDAAAVEFAEHGFAGARVDRIGDAAESNKAQIYRYFGDKAALFETVVQHAVAEMEAEVPFDPHDLPGYAGRLVRLHERRPEIIALCTWQRLERGAGGAPSPAGVGYARQQIDAIAEAQKNGEIPDHFPAGVLLGLVLHNATGWAAASTEYVTAIDVPDPDERARYIENAVRLLLGQPLAS
jgi:AcrR family transcriptional regulator